MATRRRRVHRRVAEALMATAQPDPDAVAYHLQRAGDERAAIWLVRAGDRADMALAWRTAEARFEAALALLENGEHDTAERAWLLLRLARLQRHADSVRMLRLLDAAREVVAEADDPLLDAYATLLSGHFHCFAGLLSQGVRELAVGVAKVRALPPGHREQLGRAMPVLLSLDDGAPNLILWLALSGRFVEARALDEPAHAARGAAGPPHPDALLGRSIASAALGDSVASRRGFRQAAAGFLAVTNHAMVALAIDDHLVMAHWAYHAEDRGERARLVAELRAAAGRAGAAVGASAAAVMAHTLLLEGAWDDARAAGEETSALWSSTGQLHLLAPWARVLALTGESARAWAALRRFLPRGAATPPGETFFRTTVALQRIAIALTLAAGDLPTAEEWLVAHDRWLAWSGAVCWRSEGQALWAAYHRASGDRATAHTHAEAALAHATEPRQPLALLAAHRLLGELDTAEGRYTKSAAHLAEALALAEACAAPYERALTLLALAELHRATGDRPKAMATLAEARALLEPLGARPALARADALASHLA